MQTSIDISLLFWTGAGLVLGLVLAFGISQLLSRNRQSPETVQLTAANAVLEQQLASQQSQYEAQLKLLQEAKVTLGQEFENLANRIFED